MLARLTAKLDAPTRRRLSGVVARGLLDVRLATTAFYSAERRPGPLVVSGFLGETLGIGRAAQLTLRALQDSGFNPQAHDLRELWPFRSFSGAPAPGGAGGVWLIHCNAPEAVVALAKARRSDWAHAYRIGYWAWELPQAPALWLRAASLFDEIWCPSRFVADSLRGARAVLRVMPHPVIVSSERPGRPPELEPGLKHVLVAGDLRSSLTRKNIQGAVRIYQRAFPEPSSDTRLVLKLVTRGEDTPIFRELRDMLTRRSDVVLVTRDMPHEEAQGFVAHSDILLHPHRAEGFGLLIAEAFLLGTPALATGYSGNLDFMADAPDLLLPWRPVPIQDPDRVYEAPGAVWAEPDTDACATRLRETLAQPKRAHEATAAVQRTLATDRSAWSEQTLRALPFARYLA